MLHKPLPPGQIGWFLVGRETRSWDWKLMRATMFYYTTVFIGSVLLRYM